MRPALLFLGASAALVALAYSRQAASVVDNATPEDSSTDSADSASIVDTVNPFSLMEQNVMNDAANDPNCTAFLWMIQCSEGTAGQANPYATCYGYRHLIADFSDHPAVTGEWRGESLANLGPSYAGKVSTAAGAYQIIKPTWLGCKRALGLSDFSPASQDAAALYLIQQAGALDLVKAGQFDQAVALCAKEWASLPGANAPGQAMRKLSDLRTAYTEAGGSLA